MKVVQKCGRTWHFESKILTIIPWEKQASRILHNNSAILHTLSGFKNIHEVYYKTILKCPDLSNVLVKLSPIVVTNSVITTEEYKETAHIVVAWP